MIDVLGYFGSRLSYSTVCTQIALALEREGLLGCVINLDDKFADETLNRRTPRTQSKTLLSFAVPGPIYETVLPLYRKVIAFCCPNTDSLAPEHEAIYAKCSSLIVPSEWCRETVLHSLDVEVRKLPLGISSEWYKKREQLRYKVTSRLGHAPRALHLTTDKFLPGRKGTEEAILACKNLGLEIHVHGAFSVYQQLLDAQILPDKFLDMSERGTSDEELIDLVSEYDIAIAPSRCEGFGMMILALCVSSIPVVTTGETGMVDYLDHFPHVHEVYPNSPYTSLNGEYGDAPTMTIEDVQAPLEDLLVQRANSVSKFKDPDFLWSWETVTKEWINQLRGE